MGEQGIRTFIAVILDPGLRAAAARWIEHLARSWPATGAVKWVEEENLHFTLRFLGELDPQAEIARVIEAAKEAARGTQPFELALAGLGAFPNLRRPRVIWLGVDPAGAEGLCALASRLDAALSARGWGPADKPFSPHLTLGRVRTPAQPANLAPLPAVEASTVTGTGAGRMTVRRLHVMRSRLTRQGPLYSPLAVCPLAGQQQGGNP